LHLGLGMDVKEKKYRYLNYPIRKAN
jgi:hypothetical protein